MPRYLLSVFVPADAGELGPYGSRSEMEEAMTDTGAFNEMLRREGHLVLATGLEPVGAAVTVDGQGPECSITDGPYLETTEHLGGFWVIEAAGMEEAQALAAQASRACRGVVEVRAFRP